MKPMRQSVSFDLSTEKLTNMVELFKNRKFTILIRSFVSDTKLRQLDSSVAANKTAGHYIGCARS